MLGRIIMLLVGALACGAASVSDCFGCLGGDYHGMPLKACPNCCRKIKNRTTTMSVAIKSSPYCSPIVILPDFPSLSHAQINRHSAPHASGIFSGLSLKSCTLIPVNIPSNSVG